jgi:hypothetical protein
VKLSHLTGNGKQERGSGVFRFSGSAHVRESMFEFASVLMFLIWSQLFPVLCFWLVWFMFMYIYIYLYMFFWSVCMSVNCSLPQAVANECLLVRTMRNLTHAYPLSFRTNPWWFKAGSEQLGLHRMINRFPIQFMLFELMFLAA